MKNMGSIISSHNKEVLNPVMKIMDATAGRMKAVRQTTNALCPTSFTKLKLLKTLTTSIKYLGAVKTSFKQRYSKHMRDFKHKNYISGD